MSDHRRLLQVLVGGACAVVVIAGMRASSGILNPVLMAGFLALLLQPLLRKLRRFGGAATFLVVLTVILVGLLLVGFIAASLRQVALELPRYQAQFEGLLATAVAQFEARGIDAVAYIEQAITGDVVGRLALRVSGFVAGSLGNVVLIVFIFAFMLGGMWELERRAGKGAKDHSPLAARFLGFSETIRGYMGVRAVLGLAAAVLNYVLLRILGVDNAELWGVLSFILSFVPNIGFALSMIPPLLLALLEHGWISAVIVFVGYQAINTVIDNVIGPRMVGRQMNISALLSFLSVIFWSWVLGPTGAILSVPLTVLIRDLALGLEDAPDIGPPAPVTSSTVPGP